MTIRLTPLLSNERAAFIHDLQEAFAVAFVAEYGEQAADCISAYEIETSLDADGAAAFHIEENGQKVGGVVLVIDEETRHNKLDLLFIKPSAHGRGIGTRVWKLIESTYPDTLVWETVTPYFEKRNIHFYVNKCGFSIVEFITPWHRTGYEMLESTPGKDYFFRFMKKMP